MVSPQVEIVPSVKNVHGLLLKVGDVQLLRAFAHAGTAMQAILGTGSAIVHSGIVIIEPGLAFILIQNSLINTIQYVSLLLASVLTVIILVYNFPILRDNNCSAGSLKVPHNRMQLGIDILRPSTESKFRM